MKGWILSFVILALFVALHVAIVYSDEQVNTDSVKSEGTVKPELRSETVGSTTNEVADDDALDKIRESISTTGEKIQFQAEINQLLGIIINSLYSNKEIFLRELISNASDALDKIRFISLTNKEALNGNEKLEIRIRAYPEKNKLVIRDTGIGMTKKDLVNNLGTIAKSGTKAFVEKLQNAQDNMNLIGQFGVGFYSAFLVADTVTVVTKHNDDKQHVWESKADNSFSIIEDPRGDTLGRGTEITLHLKDDDDAKEMLNQNKLTELIEKYSEFIHFPIYLYTKKEVSKEVPVEEENKEETSDEGEKKTEEKKTEEEKKDEEEKIDIEDAKDEEKKEDKPKTKTITETVYEWKLMNENKPIWTRDPKEITDEEYINFYKTISKDTEPPLTWIHFKGEGQVDFRAILFIPGRAPFNLFDFSEKKTAVKLYVKRVFITDAITDLLPRYLNFIRGVVDSDDLPLNISREVLQNSRLLRLIKAKLVHKAISMVKQLADKQIKAQRRLSEEKDLNEELKKQLEEDNRKFNDFHREFGKVIKLGIIEDSDNKNRLTKLLRFATNKSEFDLIPLDHYIARMKPNQKYIYYIAGETLEEVRKSPFMEEIKKRDLEVLYCVDPIDEYMIQHLKEYDGKELHSITREDVKFDDEKEEDKKSEEEVKKNFEPLTNFFKDLLGQKVIKATVGKRFTSAEQSPCVVSATQYGYTANMYRIMKAQTLGTDQLQQVNMFANAKILEVNPFHPVIIQLNEKVKQNKDDSAAKNISSLLFETALLRSGYPVEDSAIFADHIFEIMKAGLNNQKHSQPSASESSQTDEVSLDDAASEESTTSPTTTERDEL